MCFEYVPKFFKINLPITYYKIDSEEFKNFLEKNIGKNIILCGSGGKYIFSKFKDVFKDKNVIYIPISRDRNTGTFVNKITKKTYKGEFKIVQGNFENKNLTLIDDVIYSGGTIKYLNRFFEIKNAISILGYNKKYKSFIYIKEENALSYLLYDLLKDVKESIFYFEGLLPVVVTNTKGEVLMLAYANYEALKRTLKSKLAWFYSRSRKKLWLKGETSGNIMKVLEVKIDCDNDAILYVVENLGNACHTGNKTCFYKTLI